jgi:hypothetical protein
MNILWCCIRIYVSDPQHCKLLAIDKLFFSLYRLFFFVFCYISPCILSSTPSRIPTLPRSESYRSMLVFVTMSWLSIFNDFLRAASLLRTPLRHLYQLSISMPRAQSITKSDIDLRRVNRNTPCTRSRSENTPTFPATLEGPQLCHDSKRGADR